MKYLVFIETSDIGVRYCAESSIKLGMKPLFVVDLSQYQGDTRAQLLNYEHIDVKTSDKDEVRKSLSGIQKNIGAITSLLDSQIALAIELSVEFRCGGLDASLLKIKDKASVASLVPEFSPKTLRFSSASLNTAELVTFFRSCPSGVVMKLCRGTGALAMEIARSEGELTQALDQIAQKEVPPQMGPDSWVLQELIEGELVSCEGYVSPAEVSFIGFTGRRKIIKTESQAIFPYESNLDPVAVEVAKRAIITLVGRSGIQRGYFHVEFIFSGARCRLIDANFGRIGGGTVAEMIALSFGVNPLAIYQHLLEISLRGVSDLQPFSNKLSVISKSMLYGASVDLHLEKLELPENMQSSHFRLLSDGAQVPAMGSNNWAWIGILTGVIPIVDEEFAQIRLITKEGVKKPVC